MQSTHILYPLRLFELEGRCPQTKEQLIFPVQLCSLFRFYLSLPFSKLGCPNLLLSSISRQNSHLNKMSVCLMGIVNESRLWSWSCLSIISTRWLSKSNWDFSHLFNRLLPSSFDAANNFVNQWEVKQHNESFWLNAFHVRLLQCLPLNFVISFKNCSFKRILAIRQSCRMATGYWNIRGTNNNE